MQEDNYKTTVTGLWRHYKQKTKWITTGVNIQVHESLEMPGGEVQQAPITIDLMDTVGQRSAVKRKLLPEDIYWLPPKFCANNADFREKVLTPYFVLPCTEAGFNLVARGWQHEHNFVKYMCSRCRYHTEKPPKDPAKVKPETVTRTARPIKQEDATCKFLFKVYWNPDHKRWYIPKEQAGCREHTGHTKREPHECRLYLKHLGKDAVELAIDTLKSAIRPSQVADLLSARCGHLLDDKQIRSLKVQMRKSTVVRMDIVEDIVQGKHFDSAYEPTPADRLLAGLESNPKYSFTVLYAQHDSEELKVYHRDKDTGCVRGRTHLSNHVELSKNDEADTIQSYSDKVRDRLGVTGTSCILLAVAWTTIDGQRKLDMFPEFTCSDTTHGTNAEKRPLILYCGQDGDNKSFTHTWAFLPSQTRWVFDWFFGYACPALHQREVLARNIIHITDQDFQEVGAFDSARALVYPRSKHRLCAFHKINRNFVKDGRYKSHM